MLTQEEVDIYIKRTASLLGRTEVRAEREARKISRLDFPLQRLHCEQP